MPQSESDKHWEIRAETLADIPGIRAVHRNAFPTAYEAELVDKLRTSSAWADLSFVALAGNAVVGHVLLTMCDIVCGSEETMGHGDEGTRDGDNNNKSHGERTETQPALCLGPLAVSPAHQRRGIGTQLVTHALSEVARVTRGLPVIVLGPPHYYARFGFRPARHCGVRARFNLSDPDALMVLSTGPVRAGVVRYADAFRL